MNQNSSQIKYCICIDLDDTLYNEVDYVLSGYRDIIQYLEMNKKIRIKKLPKKKEILENRKTHIQKFINKNKICFSSIKFFINILRNHKPSIKISKKNIKKLALLKKHFKNLILITNGRSITQRNKINSLKIKKFFNKILISDEIGVKKPNIKIYKKIFKEFPNTKKVFIGDNLKIDLSTPISQNEKTILIKNKKNRIHELNEKEYNYKKLNLKYENFHNIKINDIKKLFC